MKKIFFATLLIFLPLSSHALLELRAGYGQNTFDEDTYVGQDVKNMKGYNLDVIFEPPMLTDLGLGLRYENMGFDFEAGGSKTGDAEMKRISALINYRIIDFIAYFGVLGTVGLNTDFETNALTDWDTSLTYTIGIEGGVNLGIFSIGAELGKFFGKAEHAGLPDLELDSVYAKVLVGIDI